MSLNKPRDIRNVVYREVLVPTKRHINMQCHMELQKTPQGEIVYDENRNPVYRVHVMMDIPKKRREEFEKLFKEYKYAVAVSSDAGTVVAETTTPAAGETGVFTTSEQVINADSTVSYVIPIERAVELVDQFVAQTRLGWFTVSFI